MIPNKKLSSPKVQKGNRKLRKNEIKEQIAITEIQDNNEKIEEIESRRRVAIAQTKVLQESEVHTVKNKCGETLSKENTVVGGEQS